MDINFLAIGFSAIGLLLLAVLIYGSVRTKSIWGGLALSTLSVVISALVVFIAVPIIGLIFLFPLVPERTQLNIGLMSTFMGLFGVIVFAFIPNQRRLKKAGGFVDKEREKNAQLIQGAIMFLFVYCNLTVVGVLLPRAYIDESYRRNIFWWVAIICLALYSYYSFEYREKGFVHRGRIILFSNIEHAEWVDKWNKIKLKVRLINTKQETILNIPLDMSSSIDDYLGKNFPRP